MIDAPIWLPAAFLAIAFVYSTAGFAGGSSYLAVLILAGMDYREVPPVALACNLIVSACACVHYARGGHFDIRRVAPFVVLSVPAAYLGGRIPLDRGAFCLLLGLSLLAAASRMLLPEATRDRVREPGRAARWTVGLPAGAGLGMLSGLVGIGGGVFLNPLLVLMRWADSKQAAAASAFFILVNSAAGLAGHAGKSGLPSGAEFLTLAAAVFLGGQLGGMVGSYRLPKPLLQRVTGVLILYVSIHLLWRAFA